jgi:F0F1-type ATP synthase assembly protein I
MQTDSRHQRPTPDTSLQEELGQRERPMSVSYGIIGAILVLGALGFVLDRQMGSTPWLMLGGLFLGLGLGFYSLKRFITPS